MSDSTETLAQQAMFCLKIQTLLKSEHFTHAFTNDINNNIYSLTDYLVDDTPDTLVALKQRSGVRLLAFAGDWALQRGYVLFCK